MDLPSACQIYPALALGTSTNKMNYLPTKTHKLGNSNSSEDEVYIPLFCNLSTNKQSDPSSFEPYPLSSLSYTSIILSSSSHSSKWNLISFNYNKRSLHTLKPHPTMLLLIFKLREEISKI